MNELSDNHSIANDMLNRAVQDFHDIDRSGSGRLNLVDIMAYEKTGPQQKKVGQFLEKNMDTLAGFNTNEKAHGYIDFSDLQQATMFSGGDMDQINKAEEAQATHESQITALQTVATSAIPAAVAAGAFGPETLLLTVPMLAGVGALSYWSAHLNAMDKQSAMQANSDRLAL